MDRDYGTAKAATSKTKPDQTAKAPAEAVSVVVRDGSSKSVDKAPGKARTKNTGKPASKASTKATKPTATRKVQGKTPATSSKSKQGTTLTAKQAAFVREYLIDLNATQAAIRAGYSENTAHVIGHENLSKPNIAAAIVASQQERARRTEVTADRVLAELAKIGFSDMRDVISWTGTQAGEDGEINHGLQLIPSDQLTDSAAAAISEIVETPNGLRVKLHDKRAALVDMGKHLGMFKEQLVHSGGIEVKSVVEFVDPPRREQ